MGSGKPALLEYIELMWLIRLLPQSWRKEVPMLINCQCVKGVLYMLSDLSVDEGVWFDILGAPR
jgi:hypothetical protein